MFRPIRNGRVGRAEHHFLIAQRNRSMIRENDHLPFDTPVVTNYE
jgi:hypothetical protein